MIIREATREDLPRVANLFRSIVAAGESYAAREDLDDEDVRSLWFEASPGRCVVAEIDGMVVGCAKMGPNRPGRGAHISTASFLVDLEFHGRGIGRALGEYALDWARSQGYHGMQFNAVVETNAPAVHLWKSLGFEIMTTIPEAFEHPQHGRVGLHVMYQVL